MEARRLSCCSRILNAVCNDTGKSLLYVYSQNYPMQEILKYESDTWINGCSLKSINVTNGKLTLDLFGKCSLAPETSTEDIKPKTYKVTRLEFRFNGKQLLLKKKSHLTLPDRDEISHGVQINIVDKHLPAPHEL